MNRQIISLNLFLLLILGSSGCKKNDSSSTQPLNQQQGITVHLNSDPSGASIDLDGGTTGKTTPSTFTNLSTGTHRFRIYRNQDYSELDTSLYLQHNDERTITTTNVPLWNHSWTGTQYVGYWYEGNLSTGYTPWAVPFDSVRVPTTLNAKITVAFTDQRCASPPAPASIVLGHAGAYSSFSITSSPFVIQTSNGLTPGLKAQIFLAFDEGACCDPYCSPSCCVNRIVVTSVKLETY